MTGAGFASSLSGAYLRTRGADLPDALWSKIRTPTVPSAVPLLTSLACSGTDASDRVKVERMGFTVSASPALHCCQSMETTCFWVRACSTQCGRTNIPGEYTSTTCALSVHLQHRSHQHCKTGLQTFFFSQLSSPAAAQHLPAYWETLPWLQVTRIVCCL